MGEPLAFYTHLLDLQPQLLDKIFKRMDIKSLETLGLTCKYLKERVANFRLNNTHLFDLPPELLDEIFKIMDIDTLETMESTCKYLKGRLANFRLNNKELIEEKIMARYEDVEDTDLAGYVDDRGFDDYDDYDCGRSRWGNSSITSLERFLGRDSVEDYLDEHWNPD